MPPKKKKSAIAEEDKKLVKASSEKEVKISSLEKGMELAEKWINKQLTGAEEIGYRDIYFLVQKSGNPDPRLYISSSIILMSASAKSAKTTAYFCENKKLCYNKIELSLEAKELLLCESSERGKKIKPTSEDETRTIDNLIVRILSKANIPKKQPWKAWWGEMIKPSTLCNAGRVIGKRFYDEKGKALGGYRIDWEPSKCARSAPNKESKSSHLPEKELNAITVAEGKTELKETDTSSSGEAKVIKGKHYNVFLFLEKEEKSQSYFFSLEKNDDDEKLVYSKIKITGPEPDNIEEVFYPGEGIMKAELEIKTMSLGWTKAEIDRLAETKETMPKEVAECFQTMKDQEPDSLAMYKLLAGDELFDEIVTAADESMKTSTIDFSGDVASSVFTSTISAPSKLSASVRILTSDSSMGRDAVINSRGEVKAAKSADASSTQTISASSTASQLKPFGT
jgi:hypothetical protein